MDCVLSLLVSWQCTIVINDNYWRLPPLLLCSLLIPLTLEMISIRLSVAIENRIHLNFYLIVKFRCKRTRMRKMLQSEDSAEYVS